MRYFALFVILLGGCAKSEKNGRDAGAAVASSIPLDMPKSAGSGDIETIFTIFLVADGTTIIDGNAVGNDNAIQPFAHRAYRSLTARTRKIPSSAR